MNTEQTGKLIAELRREQDLTQAQLAERIHVSDKAVSRWETGRGYPDLGNLEELAEALGVTVAELIKGERLPDAVPKEELKQITAKGISLTEALLSRRRNVNLLLGFLVGLVLLTLAVVHLTSPIYIDDAAQAVTVEELPDGRVVATLAPEAAGYQIEDVDGDRFLSCYRTRWSDMTGPAGRTMVYLGKKDELGRVYYYPSADGDALLYGDAGDGGVVTLPRLIYNGWIVIGIACTAVGIIAWLFTQKKHYGRTVLKLTGLPAAFTLSTVLCLIGHFGEVYNAAFYFTGILLLAAALYILFLLALAKRQR